MHTSVAFKQYGKPLNRKRGDRYSLIIQEIYLHTIVDASKHCPEKNGDRLTTVSATC